MAHKKPLYEKVQPVCFGGIINVVVVVEKGLVKTKDM